MPIQILAWISLGVFAVSLAALLTGRRLYAYIFGLIAGPLVLLSFALVFISLQAYGLPTGADEPLRSVVAPVMMALGWLAAGLQVVTWIYRALRPKK